MLKDIKTPLLAFDIEWVPDPESARRLQGITDNPPWSVQGGYEALWGAGGATPERPQPYLKTILCRIVTIVGIARDGPGQLKLVRLPDPEAGPIEEATEAELIDRFLFSVGRRKHQLVGYNSHQADVPILIQRAIVHGLNGNPDGDGFANRPDKPWLGPDYFSHASDWNIDLAPGLGRYQQMPTLHEAAVLSGIPGKIDVSGAGVPELWLAGRLDHILAYNCCDAFTTFLLWARIAHFSGLLSADEWAAEKDAAEALLEDYADQGEDWARRFREKWHELGRG